MDKDQKPESESTKQEVSKEAPKQDTTKADTVSLFVLF